MATRKELAARIVEAAKRWNEICDSGLTFDGEGRPLEPVRMDRVIDITGRLERGSKSVEFRVSRYATVIHLRVRASTGTLKELEAWVGEVENQFTVLIPVKDEAVIVEDRALQLIGAIRRELDAAEAVIRAKGKKGQFESYALVRKIEQLRKEILL